MFQLSIDHGCHLVHVLTDGTFLSYDDAVALILVSDESDYFPCPIHGNEDLPLAHDQGIVAFYVEQPD